MNETTTVTKIQKARPRDFIGRYREIVSDPLNLFIRRVPDAGMVADDLVTLHNGHRVALRGPSSYYNTFSDILVINRGVHEPLEEFVFQQMLPTLPEAPVTVELGALWAHYSMWVKQARPKARCIMVEPDPDGLEAGRTNFARHGYDGTFERNLIGKGYLTVDDLMDRHGIAELDLLHADIQGFEADMLDGAARAIGEKRIARLFVSTHSQALHGAVHARLREAGYRIDANGGHARHTTSHDGLVVAVRPDAGRFVTQVAFMGREDIAAAGPEALAAYVAAVAAALNPPSEHTSHQSA